MTFSTLPSSEINLRQQIKELTYINRVEARATCIRSFGRPVYRFGQLTLALEKHSSSFLFQLHLCKRPVTNLTLVKLQAYCFTYPKLHTLLTYLYISNMTKTELLHKYFSKILLKFSENFFCRISLNHCFRSSFDSLKH